MSTRRTFSRVEISEIVLTPESSAGTLGRKIIQHHDLMKPLKKYIAAAVELPENEDDFANNLGLLGDSLPKEELQDQINHSLELNREIKHGCKEFDDGTLSEMTTLIKKVYLYSAKAQSYMPILAENLKLLANAKQFGLDAATPRAEVNRCLDQSGNAPKEIKSQADLVNKGLGEFLGQCKGNAKKAKQRMQSLDFNLGLAEQVSGPLTAVVERLESLAQNAKSNSKSTRWIPYLGEVPVIVYEDPACHELFMLLRNGGQNIVHEKTVLTYKAMRSRWEVLVELLTPAIDAVGDIRGFFDLLDIQLDVIADVVSDVRKASESHSHTKTNVDPYKESWVELTKTAQMILAPANAKI